MRGLSSLLLSEAELERKSLLLPPYTLFSLSTSLFSPSFFLLFRSLFRESTHRPGLARTLVPRYVATPYRVLNTNRDVSFREFPEDFQDAIITINEEVNDASGSSRCLLALTVPFEHQALRKHLWLYLRSLSWFLSRVSS